MSQGRQCHCQGVLIVKQNNVATDKHTVHRSRSTTGSGMKRVKVAAML